MQPWFTVEFKLYGHDDWHTFSHHTDEVWAENDYHQQRLKNTKAFWRVIKHEPLKLGD